MSESQTPPATPVVPPISDAPRDRQASQFQALVPFVPVVNFDDQLRGVRNLRLADVVEASPFAAMAVTEQIDRIVAAFNRNVKEPCIVGAGARAGERVEPGCFMLAHMNKVPEIAAGKGDRLTLKLTSGYTETGFIPASSKTGIHKMTEPVLGDFGSFIVNVPQGKYALIWSGQTPRILGPGSHVIHDIQFRVEAGGNFLVPEVTPHLSHGNLHIIRVPVGSFAKVVVDTKPMLLPYRSEPYVFDTALFTFSEFVQTNESYISHGPLHLIRVPAGSVAKVWLGSKPLLLEYREEPYFFDDPLFRAVKGSIFESAAKKHITHGSISRVRPGVDGDLEIAVLQVDGDIYFIDRFTTIDSSSHAILGFLNTGIVTCVFPSAQTREERRRENPRATLDEISFEPMTTRDSLKVGLKLLVAYQVNDPHKVMKKLRMQDIMSHVESLAVSDLMRAVQNSTSQNFLHSSGKNHEHELEAGETLSVTDKVRGELKKHLDDCGLSLVRLSIEESKILDEELAREMAKQALVAAKASAEQAVIEQKAAVAKSNAELEAMSRRVKQEQDNQIRISAARAELEAQRLAAEGIVCKAEAEQKAAELRGEQFRKYPELLQLELAKIQAEALKSWRVTLIAPELSSTPFGTFPGGSLSAAQLATIKSANAGSAQ